MTNQEALFLLKFSKESLRNIGGYEFKVAIISAEDQLEKTQKSLQSIQERLQPSKEFMEFRSKYESLVDEYVTKNPDGTKKVVSLGEGQGQNFEISKDKLEEFNSKKEILEKENAKFIKEQVEKDQKWSKELNKECQFNPPVLNESYIPKDINLDELRVINKMLKIERSKKGKK